MIRQVMEVIHPCVAGLDVHQKTIMACRRRLMADGQVEVEVEEYGTTTPQLHRLAEWLQEWGCQEVAMESTGVLWMPVWNILEESFRLRLVNAYQLKKVPGRKSDVRDAEWIAQLLQCGLLRASFVPNAEIRSWRDLTRHRMKLLDQRTSVINRLHKVLQASNLKLSSVMTDVLGVSGRAIIQALIAGKQDPDQLADLADPRLKASHSQLVEGLTGHLSDHHRWMLRQIWEQLSFLDREIAHFDTQIAHSLAAHASLVERLDTITGIGRRSAEHILAEIGPDMAQFPTDQQVVSWAGLCPGSHESAGKQHSGKTPKGNRWLRRALIEPAWSIIRQKNTYLAALYWRLAPRRGKKRAIVAVARTILVAAWHIIKEGVVYHELGGEYFDHLDQEHVKHKLVKRLEKLGFEVELTAKPTPV